MTDHTPRPSSPASTDADMRAFGASRAACYHWPENTAEHKALRAAYIRGAADCGGSSSPAPSEGEEARLADQLEHLATNLRRRNGDLSEAAICERAAVVLRRPASHAGAEAMREVAFDFRAHLARQRVWSGKTFGPSDRAKGVVEHIRKELREIEASPHDLSEWIDVVILALDGAWRAGYSPDEIIAALVGKQTKNENRKWPDWRTMSPDAAIEHDRGALPLPDGEG